MERNKGCTFTHEAATSSEDAARSGSTGGVCPGGAIPTKAATGPEGEADVQCGCGWREAYWALALRHSPLSHAERDRLRRELADANERIGELEAARDATHDAWQRAEARGELASSTEDRDALRAELNGVRRKLSQTFRVQLAEVRSEASALRRGRDVAGAELLRLQRETADCPHCKERDALRAERDEARADLAQADRALVGRTKERDEARAELAQLKKQHAELMRFEWETRGDGEVARRELSEARARLAQMAEELASARERLVTIGEQRDEARDEATKWALSAAEETKRRVEERDRLRDELEAVKQTELARLTGERDQLCRRTEELADALTRAEEERDQARDDEDRAAARAERYEDQREDMRAERNQALAERDEARALFEQAIARGDALSDALRHALALRGTP